MEAHDVLVKVLRRQLDEEKKKAKEVLGRKDERVELEIGSPKKKSESEFRVSYLNLME